MRCPVGSLQLGRGGGSVSQGRLGRPVTRGRRRGAELASVSASMSGTVISMRFPAMAAAACGGRESGSERRDSRSDVLGGGCRQAPGALCWTGGRASLPATKERCVSVGRRLLHALSHYRQHPPNWSQPRRGWASRKKYAEGALTRAPPTPAGANTGRRRRLDARRPGRAGVGRLGHCERSGLGGWHRAQR